MLTDLLLAAWLTGIAAMLILVAAPWLFALGQTDRMLRAVDALGFLTLLTVLAVSALSYGHMLNWFTLAVGCLTAPMVRWLHYHGWAVERAVRETARHAAIGSAHVLESGAVVTRIGDAIRARRDVIVDRARRAAGDFANPSWSTLIVISIISAAAAITLYLRYAPVLGEMRLGSPDAYGVLLQARQAMHNQPPGPLTPVTAALVAALSLATSINPLHVARLLGPAIGVGTVCAAAMLTYRLTRSAPAAAAVLWILGGCTFALTADVPSEVGPAWILDRTLARHWTANDGTTALMFLLLAGIGVANFPAHKTVRIAAGGSAACLCVVALASPALLLLAIPAALAALLPQRFRYFAIGAVWTAISVAAARDGASDLAFTLPVAVVFLVTATFALAARSLGRLARAIPKSGAPTRAFRRSSRRPERESKGALSALGWEAAAVLTLVLITLAMLPHSAGALYLEHEIAAAKTLEIASAFPRRRWLIVAPIEQLAQTYGRGWFEDPASFVAKNAPRAGDPTFAFNVAVDDLFVFVEHRPFKTFESEAVHVPFPTLADPSYRQYRSLAGRASLQAQLQTLCQAYMRTHADASIYYDDAQITIYRFHIAR
jgi:hypothetical protein